MEKTQHTPNEWQIKSDYEPLTIIGNIDEPDDGRMHYTTICEVEDNEQGRANARRIVQCANSHDELVQALQNILNGVSTGAITSDHDETFEHATRQARAALTRAKEAA